MSKGPRAEVQSPGAGWGRGTGPGKFEERWESKALVPGAEGAGGGVPRVTWRSWRGLELLLRILPGQSLTPQPQVMSPWAAAAGLEM